MMTWAIREALVKLFDFLFSLLSFYITNIAIIIVASLSILENEYGITEWDCFDSMVSDKQNHDALHLWKFTILKNLSKLKQIITEIPFWKVFSHLMSTLKYLCYKKNAQKEERVPKSDIW